MDVSLLKGLLYEAFRKREVCVIRLKNLESVKGRVVGIDEEEWEIVLKKVGDTNCVLGNQRISLCNITNVLSEDDLLD